MKFTDSKTRLIHLSVAMILVAGAWATSANAATPLPLAGNARFQIGNGLPIPITLSNAIPNGAVDVVVPSASVSPQGGGVPAHLTLPTGALKNVKAPKVQGVFLFNPNVFQVQTNIQVSFPKSAPAQFVAGGRTGASTVFFCPGTPVVNPGTNPNCALGGGAKPGNGTIQGSLTYKKFSARLVGGNSQFGGAALGAITGTADVALRGALPAPCAGAGCVAAMAIANPAGTAAQGAPFGFFNSTAGASPPSGILTVSADALGVIQNVTNTNAAPGQPNPATSYGGPWTTGIVEVTITGQAGPVPELFTLTGSDNRTANGVGNISLVSGAVSVRGLSGPNSNRGWLNLCLGPQGEGDVCEQEAPVPSASAPGFAALIALMMLGGAYAMRRQYVQGQA